MDFKNVSFYMEFLEFIIGLFLLIVIFQLLVKALKFMLKGIAHAARIIFKAMYMLLAIVISVSGAGYVVYTGLLFLNHKPIDVVWTLAGLFAAVFGMIGLVNFFKNRFEFSSETPSTYTSPTSSISSMSSTRDDYPPYPDFDEKPVWLVNKLEADRLAKETKENEWQAKQDKWREAENQAIEDQKIASWKADEEKWAEFDRKRAEEDEYNRQEKAKWSQQDE